MRFPIERVFEKVMGNTLKNFSKEGQKLPMFGVGPYLIYGMSFLEG